VKHDLPAPNYDESLVPNFVLPDPLQLESGARVRSGEDFLNLRRPELLEAFRRHVYGRFHAELTVTSRWKRELQPVCGGLGERGELVVELSNGNGAALAIDVLIHVPRSSRPSPAFLGLNLFDNQTLHPDPSISLARGWLPENVDLGLTGHVATEASRGLHAGRWPIELVLSRGYALLTAYAGDIDPDYDDGFRNGVHGLLPPVSGARPVPHWDATLTEVLTVENTRWARTIHVGNSFPDVPTTHPFYAFIENLFHSGATGGCGLGNYCPAGTVTRAQMAVFLLKGKFGSSHVPPPATGTVFADVPIGSFAADWIEELAALGITGGCGGGNYCPGNPVTRAQMAVFLLKSEHGAPYVPPNCAGIFDDVPCPSQFANWVERLAAEGITAGCGGNNFCPDDPNIRGQMAVFLVKIFGMELYPPS